MARYRYNIHQGVTVIKTNTKKYALSALAAVTMAGAASGIAMAAQPTDPGCFGRDRAAYNKEVAQANPAAPGASETGAVLSERAGTNGEINRDYKTACGGDAVSL